MSGAIIALLRGGAAAPATTKTYQWKAADNGAFTVNVTSIGGATAKTYAVQAPYALKFIACFETATDDGGSTTVQSNVLGPLAFVEAAPVVSGADPCMPIQSIHALAGIGGI